MARNSRIYRASSPPKLGFHTLASLGRLVKTRPSVRVRLRLDRDALSRPKRPAAALRRLGRSNVWNLCRLGFDGSRSTHIVIVSLCCHRQAMPDGVGGHRGPMAVKETKVQRNRQQKRSRGNKRTTNRRDTGRLCHFPGNSKAGDRAKYINCHKDPKPTYRSYRGAHRPIEERSVL